MNITKFVPNIQLDGSDPTGHSAWGFPGMTFELEVKTPPSTYRGYQSITYTFSKPIFDPAASRYDSTVGQYALTSAVTTTAPSGNYTTQQDDRFFNLPKDAGAVTVTIVMVAYIYQPIPGPPPTDTINDSVKLTVEAPTVNSFTVADQTGAYVSADPFWFGRASGAEPDATGTNLAFVMASGQNPPARGFASMWANVSNNTHYDLSMKFVQVLNHWDYAASYTGGGGAVASCDNVVDVYQGSLNAYKYNGYSTALGQGQSAWLPVSGTNSDSPNSSFPASVSYNDGTKGYLTFSSFNIQATTNLVVSGGYMKGGGAQGTGGVSGFPIGLSAASWHLNGSARNSFNSANPTSASLVSTFASANWSTSLSAGSGSFEGYGTSWNGSWLSSGDGVSRYLTWVGNSIATANAGSITIIGSSSGAAVDSSSTIEGGLSYSGGIWSPEKDGSSASMSRRTERISSQARRGPLSHWRRDIAPPGSRDTGVRQTGLASDYGRAFDHREGSLSLTT